MKCGQVFVQLCVTVVDLRRWNPPDSHWFSIDSTALTVSVLNLIDGGAGQPAIPPSVHLFPPSSDELKTKKTGTLACLVDKFYPGAVQVTWTIDGTDRVAGVETTRPTKQGDAYMASSYLTLSENDWGSHENFICKVSHDGKSYEKSVRRSECS
ncbi:hypothetical protein lerEdw1_003672 [Lerista edwardsae]|nr:hypothetical protein lerEdw1_003672 [Lerista edwardsae]